jgi:hypothetical protein
MKCSVCDNEEPSKIFGFKKAEGSGKCMIMRKFIILPFHAVVLGNSNEGDYIGLEMSLRLGKKEMCRQIL